MLKKSSRRTPKPVFALAPSHTHRRPRWVDLILAAFLAPPLAAGLWVASRPEFGFAEFEPQPGNSLQGLVLALIAVMALPSLATLLGFFLLRASRHLRFIVATRIALWSMAPFFALYATLLANSVLRRMSLESSAASLTGLHHLGREWLMPLWVCALLVLLACTVIHRVQAWQEAIRGRWLALTAPL
jgi:hypothetical protein